MQKKNIRKKILKIRQMVNLKNKPFQTERLYKFIKNINLKKKIIGCYYPVNFEANIIELIKKLQKNKFLIGLPIIKKNFEMNFYEFKEHDTLYVNNMGIPEPKISRKIKPNILLIPLVAFNKSMYRIGYGGGYYDRYLHKCNDEKLIKIGVAFSRQRVNEFPINKYDKKLDLIFTEKNLFR